MSALKDEVRDGTRWITVEHAHWISTHVQLRDQGCSTLEYLTAVHNSANEFIVVSQLSGASSCIVRTLIEDARIDSVSTVFATAAFHERETKQMFGITFTGLTNDLLAFEGVDERALRKDFALKDRLAVEWPGAVEPDANARRRTSLPPGVFAEWQE